MRLLIILPHVSTGGLPQVALKRVELLLNHFEVYVIEYRQIAYSYVVQRNKMIELLGDNFISLGRPETEEKRDKFEYYFNKVNADVVHMEEVPEMFMRNEHIDIIYDKDRKYKLFESTHTSTFDTNNKKYFPDKFLFVSENSIEEYSKFGIPMELVEYPIDNIEKERDKYIDELGLDGDYFHILNVGLFTSDKNQGYLFELAKKLEDYKIKFHFVGNQATNFEDYWQPLMENKPNNCVVWSERNDVEKFYHACDLFMFPSTLELNPLVIKEALTYNMPIIMTNLPILKGYYDNDYRIKYFSFNIEDDIKKLFSFYDKEYVNSDKFKNLMVNNYESTEKLEYNITFLDGAKVEIFGDGEEEVDVEFIDKDSNTIEYGSKISPNTWSKTNIITYKNWQVLIKKNGKILVDHSIDLKDKNVYVRFASNALGDSIAFMPYLEEFRKKHGCNLIASTFWNNLFEKVYTNIQFFEPNSKINKNIYAMYRLGWFQEWKSTHNPNDYKKIPLQQTASDILGLDFKEIIPNITIPKGERPITEKYVCIAQYSTTNTKHWHYPYKNSNKGWQTIVDWLNVQGYKVMVISKQPTKLKNVIDRTGNFPIEHRINQLNHCEFFISISSGLSWLAWAIKKKVVMISGFTYPFSEFKKNNIRISNPDVCGGCINRHEFDRGDWNWCPDHKNTKNQFECSINITPEHVINEIIKSNLVDNVVDFNFDFNSGQIIIDEDKLKVNYFENENKITMVYDGILPKLGVDIIDYDSNEIYQELVDIQLSTDKTIWCIPVENLSGKNISLRFYNENVILNYKVEK